MQESKVINDLDCGKSNSSHEALMDTTIKSYDVFEDNAGGLHLYVKNEDGVVVYAHYGYEFTPDQLVQNMDELDELIARGESVSEVRNNWDGCEDGDLDADYRKTLSFRANNGVVIVAENDGDGDGRIVYPDKMGFNAKEALL